MRTSCLGTLEAVDEYSLLKVAVWDQVGMALLDLHVYARGKVIENQGISERKRTLDRSVR